MIRYLFGRGRPAHPFWGHVFWALARVFGLERMMRWQEDYQVREFGRQWRRSMRRRRREFARERAAEEADKP